MFYNYVKNLDFQYFRDSKWIFFIGSFIFFFNNFLFPHGLSWMFLLSPLFLPFLNKARYKQLLLLLGSLYLVFLVLHIFNGIENFYNYFKTSLLLISAIISIFAVIKYLNSINVDYLFKFLSLLNFIFFQGCLLTLFIPNLNKYLWSFKEISNGIQSFPRLQMFTPEPSHYALLLIPLISYFLLKTIIEKFDLVNIFYLIITSIPFIFSVSFGVIFFFGLTFSLINIFFFKKVLFSKKNYKVSIAGIILMTITLALIQYKIPSNPISKRLINISKGEDTSVKGRTTESFQLAMDVAKDKSFWFGVGPGQSKIIAKKYYFKNFVYRSEMPETIRFSNVSATVLASYGFIGLLLRISILIFIFILTKSYTNIYTSSLFLFIFIFQFMGSYIINFSELSIWVLSFLPRKNEFHWANV